MINLPFTIDAQFVGRSAVLVSALGPDGKTITSARYPLGEADKRSKTARQWADNPRLHNGQHLEVDDIVEKLDEAEARCLDEQCDEDGADADDPKDKPSQVDNLIVLASGCQLFREPGATDDSGTFARLENEHGVCRTMRIKSKGFRLWLRQRYFEKLNKSPRSESIQEALQQLAAKALFKGDEEMTHLRVAGTQDVVWLDLCDSEWRVVRIDAQGWRVVSSNEVPVRFIRWDGMKPHPEPEKGGNLDDLRNLINTPDGDAWALVLAWLVMALCPSGPYPILAVSGEQGSAKSTLCRFLRRLVDPNACELRRPPRDEHDCMVAASNSWVVAFDNLSFIKADLSDCLCTLATGGGFATRRLYSDSEEAVFSGARPIILNGITNVAIRADLADRAIVLNLPTIGDDQRLTEEELTKRFEALRPKFLGVLLDGVSAALRNLASVKMARAPRMADFTKWASAAESGLGLEPGAFVRAYTGNRAQAAAEALESTAIGPMIRLFIEQQSDHSWTGTAEELLAGLDQIADDRTKGRKDWPRGATDLGRKLRRIAPPLRVAGVEVDFERESGGDRRRTIQLWRPDNTCKTVSLVSRSVPNPPSEPESTVSRDTRDTRDSKIPLLSSRAQQNDEPSNDATGTDEWGDV